MLKFELKVTVFFFDEVLYGIIELFRSIKIFRRGRRLLFCGEAVLRTRPKEVFFYLVSGLLLVHSSVMYYGA